MIPEPCVYPVLLKKLQVTQDLGPDGQRKELNAFHGYSAKELDGKWPLSPEDKYDAAQWAKENEYRPPTDAEFDLALMINYPEIWRKKEKLDELTPNQKIQTILSLITTSKNMLGTKIEPKSWDDNVNVIRQSLQGQPFYRELIDAIPSYEDLRGTGALKELNEIDTTDRNISDKYDVEDALRILTDILTEAIKFRERFNRESPSTPPNGNGEPGPIGSNTLPPGLPRELQGSGGLGGMSQQQTGLAMQARPLQRRNTLTGQLEYSIDGGEEWHLGPMPTATA